MATIKDGNIFTTNCDVIVNTVNCQGVMGAGIAKEFRIRYPEMYEAYRQDCEQRRVQIGSLSVYEVHDRRVLNFPTKIQWRYPSKVEYLEQGLATFVETYQDEGITSAAFPLLGASKGGIPEECSIDVMQRAFSQCDIPIEIWRYDPTAEDDLYPIISQQLGEHDDAQISKASGISLKMVKKMRAELAKPHINSLNGLSRVKGIGDVSLTKLVEWLLDAQIARPVQLTFDF